MDDLANRQQELEESAAEKFTVAREFELRQARAFLAARGETATERKARAVEALAAAEDGLWERNMTAEGRYEGARAAMRALETRATVGMSLLRAARLEADRPSSREPQWSGAAA